MPNVSKPITAPEITTIIGEKQHELFKAIVLTHLRKSLSQAEWLKFRRISQRPSDFRNFMDEDIPANITPEQLVQGATSEDGITVNEVITCPPFSNKAVVIADIDNKPVYYIQGHGIYLWASNPDVAPILMLWATHPAYPPGW